MNYSRQWEALLDEIDEFLEDHEDVRDGSDGQPLPNKAMSLLTSLRYLRPTDAQANVARPEEELTVERSVAIKNILLQISPAFPVGAIEAVFRAATSPQPQSKTVPEEK